MSHLPELLQAALGLPTHDRVHATRTFMDGWGVETPLPVGASARAGELWLIDTRDEEGREALTRGALTGEGTVLVVAESDDGPGALRRLARRIRRPGPQRWTERRLLATVGHVPSRGMVLRLGFDSGPDESPSGFLVPGRGLPGCAYVWSSAPGFEGPVWRHVRERLDVTTIRLSELHLRARGAAVAVLEAEEGAGHVIRIVPEGPLQEVVASNHDALVELRSTLAGHENLLRRIPEPLFRESFEGTLALGETRLPGTLAWKVTGHDDTIHAGAVRFLGELGAARGSSGATLDRESVARIIRDQLLRIERAAFVDARLRRLLVTELTRAEPILARSVLRGHPSHGDYGPGNILVAPETGEVTGVIDWDTLRMDDLPGTDRVNLEIQMRRARLRAGFPEAVASTWQERAAHDSMDGVDAAGERALFGVAVCRYVTRSLSYPELHRAESGDFTAALDWLAGVSPRDDS